MADFSDDFLADQEWLHQLLEVMAVRDIEAVGQDGALSDRVAAMLSELDTNPKQRACIDDPARLVGVQGTRRSGKSSSWLKRLAADGCNFPGSHQVYVNTTRAECKRIAWRGANPKDGLLALNERYRLGYQPMVGPLQMVHPNGSIIELVGADDERAIAKALGGAYFRALFDESQKMPWLQRAIEVFGPAMMDFGGQIVTLGSPDQAFDTLFYEVMSPETGPGKWSRHYLDVLDNPHFGNSRDERYQVIVDYCATHGLELTDPRVRRAWFNEWAKEDALFVYDVHKVSEEQLCYAEPRWTTTELPMPNGSVQAIEWPDFLAAIDDLPHGEDGKPKPWHFGLVADLGYDPDPFALTVGAWSHEDPCFYEVASFKMNKLVPDQQLWLLHRAYELIHPTYVVGDAGGGGKLVVKGWEHGWLDRAPLPIQAAEKSNKATHMEFLNGDYRTGKCKLRKGSPLHKESKELQWVLAPSGKRYENVARGEGGAKRHANDCTDSWLYNHRESRHHRYQPKPAVAPYGSEAYFKEEEARLEERALEEENDDVYWQ